jgi:hypothetical protein
VVSGVAICLLNHSYRLTVIATFFLVLSRRGSKQSLGEIKDSISSCRLCTLGSNQVAIGDVDRFSQDGV